MVKQLFNFFRKNY